MRLRRRRRRWRRGERRLLLCDLDLCGRVCTARTLHAAHRCCCCAQPWLRAEIILMTACPGLDDRCQSNVYTFLNHLPETPRECWTFLVCTAAAALESYTSSSSSMYVVCSTSHRYIFMRHVDRIVYMWTPMSDTGEGGFSSSWFGVLPDERCRRFRPLTIFPRERALYEHGCPLETFRERSITSVSCPRY